MRKEFLIIALSLLVLAAQQSTSSVLARENERPGKPEKPEQQSIDKPSNKNVELKKNQDRIEATRSAKPKEITKDSQTSTSSASTKKSPVPTSTASGEIRRDKNGAQFVLDQATGLVQVTTPSGNVHMLRLPPQAIQNMFRNRIIDAPEATSAAVATSSANIDSATTYTEKVTETKLLFGTIPVKVKMNIKINTTTGETEIKPQSIIIRILGFLFTDK